ncbi:hypothetical protein MHBO_003809 [Bonamia ostreae]|uniref:Delta-aminolevulinic acid dehydratase n=1 Tax=Bonamia ostreae TaxID=126728 RepID=A0ABV2ARJ2_9EUKA
MMDNRILKIRQTLNQKNLQPIAIMSYSAKFASNLYGPFRSACKSGVAKSISSTKNSEICNKIVLKNRKTYQLPSMATNLALKASKRDELEGADFLIVKPAMFYLDIISAVSKNVLVPVAAYQVSGEYVMLFETEKRFENFEIILESLHSIKRAGGFKFDLSL